MLNCITKPEGKKSSTKEEKKSAPLKGSAIKRSPGFPKLPVTKDLSSTTISRTESMELAETDKTNEKDEARNDQSPKQSVLEKVIQMQKEIDQLRKDLTALQQGTDGVKRASISDAQKAIARAANAENIAIQAQTDAQIALKLAKEKLTMTTEIFDGVKALKEDHEEQLEEHENQLTDIARRLALLEKAPEPIDKDTPPEELLKALGAFQEKINGEHETHTKRINFFTKYISTYLLGKNSSVSSSSTTSDS